MQSMNYQMNHSIRTHEAPLDNDQLRAFAPSVFAPQPWHQMSAKYAFIPTIEVVDKMRAEGFAPVSAQQSRTRIEGKGDFTKHLIRFRDMRQSEPAIRTLGTIYPELVLTNSHDGASAYKLDAGLFRLVCLNGLVVGDKLVSSVNVRHTGDVSDILDATYEVVEQFPKVVASIEGFQRLQLSAPEQRAFGQAALSLKYEDGEAPITAEQAVTPRRSQDGEPTLWNTFNVVQERLVGGGDRYRNQTGRSQRTRGVQGIAENTRLNKALWTLAEELQKLKS